MMAWSAVVIECVHKHTSISPGPWKSVEEVLRASEATEGVREVLDGKEGVVGTEAAIRRLKVLSKLGVEIEPIRRRREAPGLASRCRESQVRFDKSKCNIELTAD